jgi:hypothetical protein
MTEEALAEADADANVSEQVQHQQPVTQIDVAYSGLGRISTYHRGRRSKPHRHELALTTMPIS